MKEQETQEPPHGPSRYYDTVEPPPGTRWESLVGNPSPTVVFLSLYVIENSGIRLLASILRTSGIKVHEIFFKDWVNNGIEPPGEEETNLLLEEITRVGADLVGISVRASAFHTIAADLTARIRGELGLPVLWGGMHPSSCPDDASKAADLICVGEAETSLPELMRRLREREDITDIPGLWAWTKEGLVRNPTAPLVQDIDALPFRDFHSPDKTFIDGRRVVRGTDPYAGQSIYLLMSSRGCPFPSCTFCSNSVTDRLYPDQKFYRLMSVDRMLEEVAYAKAHFPNLKRIRFDDEEFPVTKNWFDEFCERWPREAGLPFEIHIDPRVVSAERLERLRAVGLDMAFMGIQSTARINRELYCRNVSDEEVLAAATTLHRSGIRAGYQVILDDPVSTDDDKRLLFELILKLDRPYEMILFSLTIYPGSALEEELKRRGLIAEGDVEGPATKVFRQFRVDLSYARSRDDRFWTALIVLASKSFIPKALLRILAASSFLARHPGPLVLFAFAANVAKVGIMGTSLLLRGELSWELIRRWLSFRSLVTY